MIRRSLIYIAQLSAVTKVSNVLNTLISREKPGFQAVSKGLIVLLCAEVIRQRAPDHGAVHGECSACVHLCYNCEDEKTAICRMPLTNLLIHLNTLEFGGFYILMIHDR